MGKGGVVGGGRGREKNYEFQIQIFKVSDCQIFDFQFLFFLEIFSEKYVGEISRNK